jgi:hypothetical protein
MANFVRVGTNTNRGLTLMVQMILMLSLFLEKMILIFRESNQVIRMTTEIRLPHCIEVHSLTNFHILRWDVSIKSIY